MFSWHAIPFARILVPFIIGICFALYCPFPEYLLIPFFAFFFGVSIFIHFNRNINLKFRFKVVSGILITFTVILLGYLRAYFYSEERQPEYFAGISSAKYFSISIDDAVVEKEKYYRCYAKINSVLDSAGKCNSANGTILFYLRKKGGIQKPVIGDRYIVKANARAISEPSNPEEFNYKQYLSYRNIHFQLFSDSSGLIKLSEPRYSAYRYATLLRDKSLNILQKYIRSPKELGVAEALLLGYKDDLDPDITAAFSRTGTLHVLAVSGLHAGIIYLILAFITAPLSKRKYGRILQVLILLTGIWLYAFITGLSSSVLRASIMFSFMAIGKLLKYHVNIYNNLYSSAFILLLYNPFFIMDVGFQLSYLAVLGIVFIQPMIHKWYRPRYKIDKYIWGLISVSLAAQVLTFPVSIFYFHQFPNYFLLSNLLIIPITSIILVGLILLLSLHPIPFAAVLLGKALLLLLQFNNWLVQGLDNLPNSYVNGLNFNIIQLFLMYAVLLFLLAWFVHRYKPVLFLFLFFTICFWAYFAIIRKQQYHQRILTVHQIKGHDVYTCIDGRIVHILADSGFINNESAIRFFLEPYFWSHGISGISKHDLQNSFVGTNIFYLKNTGFQFYDRILTIDKVLPESVQNTGILILKNPKSDYLKNLNQIPIYSKIAGTTSNRKKEGIKKQYFKYRHIKLKEYESFILIDF